MKNKELKKWIVGIIISGLIGAIITALINRENLIILYKKITDGEKYSKSFTTSSLDIDLFQEVTPLIDDIKSNNTLQIKETFISPLNTYNRISSSEEVSDYKSWLSTEGCVLNAYVQNMTDKNIAVSEYKLVIDKVQATEIPYAEVVSLCSNNKMHLYVVNSGNAKLTNAKVKLSAYTYDMTNPNAINIDNVLSSIVNIQNEQCEIELPDVNAGQILEFASYDMNPNEYDNYLNNSEYVDIEVYANVFLKDDKKTDISSNYLGIIGNDENGDLGLFTEGGSSAESIKRETIIDLSQKTPFDINLKTEFKIDANDTEFLQVAIFTKKTCEISFHVEIKKAGGNFIKSDVITQKILVPLYDTSMFLCNIQQWLEDNNITNYNYNDNPSLQEFINYKFDEEYIY